jgi:hypothetical protein
VHAVNRPQGMIPNIQVCNTTEKHEQEDGKSARKEQSMKKINCKGQR